MKLQFRLVAETPSTAPAAAGEDLLENDDLEMLGPPHAVCFQSASLKVCGQSVELLEDYNRAYVAMEQLLPAAAREMNGAESLPLVDPNPSPS